MVFLSIQSFLVQIKAEFGRIFGKQNPVKEMTESLQQTWVRKVIAYAETQPAVASDILSTMEDAIMANPSKKNGKCFENSNSV